MSMRSARLKQGALLMLIGSLAFIGYSMVFLFRNFAGGGFELGVETLNGVTRDNLNSLNPAIMHYIGHLHVATAAFIAATGIAVAALSWWGVRRGEWWAWIAAVVSPVVGLAVALPYHYTGTFQPNWVDAPRADLRSDRRLRGGGPAGAGRDDSTDLSSSYRGRNEVIQ